MDRHPRKRRTAVRSLVLGSALAAVLAAPAIAADVDAARLENADTEPQNWLLPFQNYQAHRYSRLSQVNRDNVADLKVAFVVPMSDALLGREYVDLENHPLVDDGFMFIDTGTGIIYKIDLRAGTKGTVLWKADAGVSTDEQGRTRGMTMWGNAVYHNLTDGRVVAVDRDTGEFLWDKQIARIVDEGHSGVNADKEGFTAAPLAAEGKILVGQSKGDNGTRGWLAAVDAATGEELWRTYTVPKPDEPGGETWADDHGAWKTGGAALWTTGSYDPEQRITIWGGAQPVPMFDPEFRPGDNLYSNAAIAFNMDNGNIEWYYQYVPNESWDYDENGVHMLIDAPFQGTDRQTVVHFGRNGFAYQLDRTNGAFIHAKQYVDKVTWTAGLDPKTGLPIEYDPNLELQRYIPETRWARADTEPKTACPPLPGGLRWQPPAYNPVKQIAYAGGEDGCQTHMIMPALTLPDGGIDEQGRRKPGSRGPEKTNGLIAAYDVTTGEVTARRRYTYPLKSGILATAGGLLFTGFEDGSLTANHDETLEELWRFETGIGIKAPWISYSVNNKQYLAIAAGARTPGDRPELGPRIWGAMLFVFSL